MTKTILITGASRGIGRAAAILAGQKGWSVGVNYIGNRAAADEVVAAVIAAGGKAKAIQGDVANEADVIAMFKQTEELGPLDGLVINAGIVAPASKLMNIDTERLKRMFDVNILGAYVCAREGVRRMARSRGGKGGSIVILSSAAARLGGPSEYVDYAGSKGAMDTLTIGLSKEVGAEGIRVNAVRPGLIETDIHASGGQPDRAQRLGVMAPLGRPGTADEVGESIVWLLSDAASYVTGALLDVTGGR
ncbi:SDR family oxidoreductase [Phyllobacterium myrsinacearum]|uniref:Oxidoreductase n=1 Tax=Phyllobacterium myrsinacearum TaxID=28101 RepID=A0A2S9JC47_9HYPH|nr:SDR family oxidoreductase [Phyllobacterium myrsinacearum]PRD50400.1 oxidoreductase [Phyllobacterium myrsinacearum]PWV95075.1 NAD(P)-dependent dehydrogenase (short-subunit alcohol dehydrogenase family) [Phyllobacterium myrsinacearum]RZV06813.1 NAD(P)-dependent dehydrogenase (short-subunit alcohol dehydrogenase family) [Phyllobacterium myrsinacearum]